MARGHSPGAPSNPQEPPQPCNGRSVIGITVPVFNEEKKNKTKTKKKNTPKTQAISTEQISLCKVCQGTCLFCKPTSAGLLPAGARAQQWGGNGGCVPPPCPPVPSVGHRPAAGDRNRGTAPRGPRWHRVGAWQRRAQRVTLFLLIVVVVSFFPIGEGEIEGPR